jgi:phosphatidylglycerophosphatase A
MTSERRWPPTVSASDAQARAPAPAASVDHATLAPRRASVRFMLAHPAHWIALGFGSGLAPRAPGTIGTLWAWISFLLLDLWLDDVGWAFVIGFAAGIGVWACTRTAQHMRSPDPGAIVWDEVLAFWIVLWLVTPAPGWQQLLAFALFRLFDAVKRGPVGWADRRFKLRPGEAIGWRQGFGIMFDDLVAALMTLLVLALAFTVAARWPGVTA